MNSREVSRILGNVVSGLTVANTLGLVGLERKKSSSILPALGVFGAGLAVGAAVGLLLSPRGAGIREGVGKRIGTLAQDLRAAARRAELHGPESRPPQQVPIANGVVS